MTAAAALADRMGPTTPGQPIFAWQFCNPSFVLDLRPGHLADPPARRSAPDDTAGAPPPCVLIVSRAADREAHRVRSLLRRAGIPCLRLDAEAAGTAGLAVELASRTVLLDGVSVRPTVTWIRHFGGRAILSPHDAVSSAFAQDSWNALIGQLAAVSGAIVTSQAPGIMAQLALAAEHGIKVPRTVVTTDLALAHDFLASDLVVVKALHQHFVEAEPGRLTGVFPQIVPRHALLSSTGVVGVPVVVQEFVSHDSEIRAYYVRGEVLTFCVAKKAPADPWLRPAQVQVRAVEASPAVSAAAARIAAAMDLRYGACDFLIAAGEPVFLELNASGDWLWLEEMSGTHAVTATVARMLTDLHRQAVRIAGAPDGRLSNYPDIITFLT
jgi:hypothetical protein